MSATIAPDVRTAACWNQCIGCGAVRSTRFFCNDCLSSGVDAELMHDNPILHRSDGGVGCDRALTQARWVSCGGADS